MVQYLDVALLDCKLVEGTGRHYNYPVLLQADNEIQRTELFYFFLKIPNLP